MPVLPPNAAEMRPHRVALEETTSARPSPLLAVVGATASGKTALSLDVAQALGGEIVGADASQLYRGMDIGTAKLPPEQRRGIAHHQIDVLDIHDEASVAAYQRHARADLAAIAARGHRPILVGGSGLYVRAALDDLDIPPTDPVVRAEWEARLAQEGVAALYDELARRDPVAAAAIEPRNGRRIVRALEAMTLTGRPFSASMPTRRYLQPTLTIGVQLARPLLDERILRRVHDMYAEGLLEEVQRLLDLGLADTRTASRAVGYAQAIAHLAGELNLAEAIEATATATRRLARRQESWFRADPRVTWLDADAPDLTRRALDVIAANESHRDADHG